MYRKKTKGFTLVELITVLAIIAVLTGVLIPSASYFLRNSKLKTANAQAKIVFNAALTVSQEYESKNLDVCNDNNGNPGSTSSIEYSFVAHVPSSSGALGGKLIEKVNTKVMEVPDSDRDVWAVRYKKVTGSGDFPVLVAACYAPTENDRYVGCYPVITESTGISMSDYQSFASGGSGRWLNYAETGSF